MFFFVLYDSLSRRINEWYFGVDESFEYETYKIWTSSEITP